MILPVIFCGCLAVVNETKEGKKVKSFIVTDKEVRGIIDQAENKDSAGKTLLFNFIKKEKSK
jgi:hypothetical protein